MNQKFTVKLTTEEKDALVNIVKDVKSSAHKKRHANILLQTDINGPNWSDKDISSTFHCHIHTVGNIKQRYVEQGLEEALERKSQNRLSREYILDGDGEARLITIACSTPPKGRSVWTLRLIASELISLNIIPDISHETVRNTLKKTNLNLI
jgi:transposase